jgi:predicted MFS family arabinose efflux permease
LALTGLALGLFGTESAIVAAIALASEVDPDRRAIFLGRMVAASSISRALAGAAGPMLLLRAGIGTNTAISAVVALAAVVVLARLVRHDPRLRG